MRITHSNGISNSILSGTGGDCLRISPVKNNGGVVCFSEILIGLSLMSGLLLLLLDEEVDGGCGGDVGYATGWRVADIATGSISTAC